MSTARSTRRWHRRAAWLALLTALLTSLATLLPISPSRAADSSPSIQVTPVSGPPGTVVTVRGSLLGRQTCAARGNYVVFHGASRIRVRVAGQPNADGTTGYSAKVVVPRHARSGAARIELRQTACGGVRHAATTPFTVRDRLPTPSSSTLDTGFQRSTSAVDSPPPAAEVTRSRMAATRPTHRVNRPAAVTAAAQDTPSINLDRASGPPRTVIAVDGNMVGPETCDPIGNSILFDGQPRVTGIVGSSGGDGPRQYAASFAVPPGTFVGQKTVEFRQSECTVITIPRVILRSAGDPATVQPAGNRVFSATAAFMVTNSPPVASSFTLRTEFGQQNSINLRDHSADPESDDGYVDGFSIVTPPAHGSATVDQNLLTYRPADNYSGPDSFTYQLCERDRADQPATCSQPPGTVSVTVFGPTPSISLTPAAGPPGTTVTAHGDMFGRDRGCSTGDTNYVLFHFPGSLARADVTPQSQVDGSVTYTSTPVTVPPGTPTGTVPVEFRQDSCGEGGSLSVSTDFGTTNRPPVASSFTLTTGFEQSTGADLAAHVTDPDGNDRYVESVQLVTQPAHGTATLADSHVTYAPTPGFFGGDSFTYRGCEQDHIEGPPTCGPSATVSVTVTPPAVVASVAATPTATCAGNQVTVVAHVTAGGAAARGSAVSFRMSMAGAGVLHFSAVTDSTGHATVLYRRIVAGNDSVSGTATVPGTGQATAQPVVIEWKSCGSVPPPPPLTTTPTPTASPTPTPTPSVTRTTPPPPPPTDGDHSLRATDPNPLPGATDTAVGHGCAPRAPVDLRLGSAAVGTGQADPSGRFRIPFQVPSLSVGRHRLVATCGPVTIDTPIDFVVTAAGSDAAGATTTVAAVLMFFVLLGGQLMRPGLGSTGALPPSL